VPGGAAARSPVLRQFIASTRDALAVLAAILVAFGLDAAWGARTEGVELRAALSAVREEFETVEAQLEFAINYNREQVEAKDSFVVLNRSDVLRMPADQAATLLNRLRVAWTFDPSRGALDGMVASGRVDRIKSADLRRLISGWPGLYADLGENTIVEWGDAVQRRRAELGLEVRMRTVAASSADTLEARQLLLVALEDSLLRNLVAAYSQRIEQYLGELEPAQLNLEETLRLLSLELDQ